MQKIYLVLYGFRAVQVARERGFEAAEFIDQSCVFDKEEELKAPLVKLFEKSEDFVAGTISNSLDELYANLESEEN